MKASCAVLVASLAAAAVLPLGAQSAARWPGFRGPSASGVADGQALPDVWTGGQAAGGQAVNRERGQAVNRERGQAVKWAVPIPGLAHSSPIVWDDLVIVTTAVSSLPNATFKPGLYGEGTASEDRTPQKWMVIALDRRTGKTEWETVAYQGVPKEKRHIKATYANATPFTDGEHVVAFFGSQGLYAFDMKGRKLWAKDLGVLNTGAYDLPEYEWGTASSPIIYNNKVIVQCDTQNESFVMASDVKSGKTIWKTLRTELPSWGTPTVYVKDKTAELVTNASNFIRGYDPDTGVERWRLGGSSKITAPTPIFSHDLVIVASGRAPERPIFAIRPGGSGDITPPADAPSTGRVVWRKAGRGSYMPTPLIYNDILYVLGNAGLLDAYDLATGAEIYRQRLEHGGSGFSASPVAADGRIYLSSEDGDVFVVRAGRTFELLAKNPMGEPIMATPALAGGTMFVRGEKHLFAIGK